MIRYCMGIDDTKGKKILEDVEGVDIAVRDARVLRRECARSRHVRRK